VKRNVRFTFLTTFLVISLLATGVFPVFPQPTGQVAIEPDKVEDIPPDENFTIELTVENAYDTQMWDANITFDPNVLEVVDAAEGPFIKSGAPLGYTFFDYVAPEGEGYIYIAASYYYIMDPGNGVNGSGILGNITFQVIDRGYTPLQFDEEDTNLFYNNGTAVSPQPLETHDGYFTNFHDIAITSVTVAPSQVNLSDKVSIDVTVFNQGNFTETFSVTTYWNIGALSEVIETKIVENLENGTSTPLTFEWDTTDISAGTGIYTISANASVVLGENDTNDNTFPNGNVTVTKLGAPVADFTYLPSKPSVGKEITFNASASYDHDGTIENWKWNFDDGNTDSDEEVNHTFIEIGTYRVTLTVEDDSGIKNTVWKPVEVLSYPVASFTYLPKPPLANQTVTFDASASTPDGGDIISHTWDFGDGNITKVVKFSSVEKYVDFDKNERYSAMDAIYKDIIQTEMNRVDPGDLRLTPAIWPNQTGSYPANSTVKPTDKDVGNTTNLFSQEGHRENILENDEYDCEEIIRLDWRFEEHVYIATETFTVNLTVTDSEGLSGSFSDDVTVSTKQDIVVDSVGCWRLWAEIKPEKKLKQAYIGETLKIYVVVRNEGTQPETFNLTVNYDGPSTGTFSQEVDNLPPKDQAPLNEKGIETLWDTRPVSAGNYTITVEALLDGDENTTNNKATTEIKMKTAPDIAITNITVSPTTVLAGDLLNITVSIKNEGADTVSCSLFVYFSNDTHSNISPTGLSDTYVSIDADKEKVLYFENWNLTEYQLAQARLNASIMSPGNYTISTEAKLYEEHRPYEFDLDDNLYIFGNVTIGASLISIFASETTTAVGSKTTINGSITPARHGANVTIWYKLSDEENWDILNETLTTNENSTYTYVWTPENSGAYHLKATWLGDNMTLSDESDILEINVREKPQNILLYAAVGAAAIVAAAAVAIYFLKIRKARKPTQ